MAELKFNCELKVIDCPLAETSCCLPLDYAVGLIGILDGEIDPEELDLDNIIKEVKSWT